MKMKLIAIAFIALGAFAGITRASSKPAAPAANDCCFPGAPCCVPGAACCE